MYFDDSSVEFGYMWHNLHTYFVEMGDLCPKNTVSYQMIATLYDTVLYS